MHKVKLAVFILLLSLQPAVHAQSHKAFELNNRGVHLLEECKFDRAIASFKAALVQIPTFRMAKTNLAIALSNKGLSLIKDGALK